jgi:hypothetical protein
MVTKRGTRPRFAHWFPEEESAMCESEEKMSASLDRKIVERIAVQIGARMRRYHPAPDNVALPSELAVLLGQLDMAERRV